MRTRARQTTRHRQVQIITRAVITNLVTVTIQTIPSKAYADCCYPARHMHKAVHQCKQPSWAIDIDTATKISWQLKATSKLKLCLGWCTVVDVDRSCVGLWSWWIHYIPYTSKMFRGGRECIVCLHWPATTPHLRTDDLWTTTVGTP
jgi:hypothetical protein